VGHFDGISSQIQDPQIAMATNIGEITGSNFHYAGGIVGYADFGLIRSCANAGIVDGAINSVGGIAGEVGRDAIIEHCINTN